MTHFPQYEVAISDADRAEIEAMYIELLRARDVAANIEPRGVESLPPDLFPDSELP